MPPAAPDTRNRTVSVAIIGSGFAGLGVALRLLDRGDRDFVILEKADEVGGTWRDNTYPGCQCDVPSVLYSLSDRPNPDWSRTYSPQAEIQAYLQRCAADVPADLLQLRTEVTDARWDDAAQHWVVQTTRGTWTARVLVAGHGALSAPAVPDITGLERFEGAVFHSAEWDHDVDVRDKRVAVIGTGASAIQIVPHVQRQAQKLLVFQRTPPWVLPHTDRPTRGWERAIYRRWPAVQRAVRTGVYWLRELIYLSMARRSWLTRRIEMLGRMHLDRQVSDPELRARLRPDYDAGCKRLLLSNRYYPALTADNAEVITEKISEVGPRSITTVDGIEHPIDVLVLATGFKVTNHPVLGLISNAQGQTLREAWDESGARAYLGTTVPAFPNLFVLGGPNTGLGHTTFLVMFEAQTTYLLDCLRTMRRRGLSSVDVRAEAADRYNADLQRRLQPTVWSAGGCASWYLDEHGRNTTMWPDFTFKFKARTRRFDVEHYDVRPLAPVTQ